MDIKNIKNNIGRYYTYAVRSQSYLNYINFLMIAYLYITTSPLGLKWYTWLIMIGVALPIILVLDISLIYPQYLQYSWLKNPESRDLNKKIDKIMKELNIK